MATLAHFTLATQCMHSVDPTSGTVFGGPKTLLRMEGVAVLALAVCGYSYLDAGWAMFAIAFLAPDLAMLGYVAGPRAGAFFYNLGHSYLLPAALGFAGFLFGAPLATSAALIWIAHIGFDRAVGYGLKYADAFKHTHLGLPFARPDQVRTTRSMVSQC